MARSLWIGGVYEYTYPVAPVTDGAVFVPRRIGRHDGTEVGEVKLLQLHLHCQGERAETWTCYYCETGRARDGHGIYLVSHCSDSGLTSS